MPDHDRLPYAQLAQRPVDQIGLSGWRPTLRPQPVRVAKARTIDGDDAIALGQPIKYPTGFEILHHRAVAVQQDEGRSRTSIEIMKVDTIDIEKAADGRVLPFSPAGAARIQQRGCARDDRCGQKSRAEPLASPPRFLDPEWRFMISPRGGMRRTTLCTPSCYRRRSTRGRGFLGISP